MKKGMENVSDEEMDVAFEGYDSPTALAISTNKSDKEWIIDSRCSFHICPDIKVLS